MARTRPCAGFTLIEVMVVLTIIGVMATTVSFSLRPDTHRALEDESYRLARVLEQAVDAAEMGEPLALEWQPHGYRWRVQDRDGGWQPSGDTFFADHPWPEGLRSDALRVDGKPASAPQLLWQGGRPPQLALTLRAEAGSRTVLLSPVGRVSVEAGE